MERIKTENTTLLTAEKKPAQKFNYINHLKVLMTVLVVLHHSFITYGAPGSWYFQQKTHLLGALFPMTVFVATNQSFFMGFFFFLSALFIAPSYQKKGTAKFLADRLKRLGIPLAFYSLVLSPILNYIVEHYGYGQHHSFMEYMSGYHHWIDLGVMWFVAALLIFNLVYLAYKNIPALNFNIKLNFPSNKQLLIGGLALGFLSFLARLIWPTGWVLAPLGFQLGYFPQYIVLFVLGIIASNNNWLNQLNLNQGKLMRTGALLMVLLVLPVIFILFLILKFPGNYFNGGWNPVALSYALWEQIAGVMIMAAMLCIAKFKWNSATPFMNGLSANAFAVYIFHPLVLISLSLLVKSWDVNPVIKLAVVAPAAVAGSFLLAGLLRKIPFVRSVI
ncbi:acyltransferase family protein [Mucilaginibacter gotjawali]|uniref:Surface polysaccharide O-acyltransferase-like enzyme n=1 Tax=Mucilaginibacter gotjawali TaxID=1550579 RepID=A0A839SKI4_9SPHI|nr:acyltransferase [Mucilaginibacter gotjawali]MBB3057049.1 surface polysaccharide O-acyltransferase-like enzyme [Mucilaginibacter gotjawali]